MRGAPALAVGTFLMGTKSGVTDYNVIYGKAAKASAGVLLCWEKTVSEVSDKLWIAVDYMGGDSFLGTTNLGLAWAFTQSISVIFGYDILNNRDLPGYADTFTTQLDINF